MISLSPETAYATKRNIDFPGSQAQATAAEGYAATRIQDSEPHLTVTVIAGSVVPAT